MAVLAASIFEREIWIRYYKDRITYRCDLHHCRHWLDRRRLVFVSFHKTRLDGQLWAQDHDADLRIVCFAGRVCNVNFKPLGICTFDRPCRGGAPGLVSEY